MFCFDPGQRGSAGSGDPPHKAKPMLDTWTDRKIIKRKVLMSADQHLYPRQAKHVFAAAVGQATGTLGQSHAGKYKPARKPLTIYTEDEVRQNVRQWRVNNGADGGTPKAGLHSMLGTHVITVGDENDEEVEGDPDEELSRLEYERDGDSQSALVDDCESRTNETPMKKQVVEGNAAMRGPGMLGGQIASSSSQRGGCGSASMISTNSAKPRVVLPGYWLNQLQVELVFQGRNCVQRNQSGERSVEVDVGPSPNLPISVRVFLYFCSVCWLGHEQPLNRSR